MAMMVWNSCSIAVGKIPNSRRHFLLSSFGTVDSPTGTTWDIILNCFCTSCSWRTRGNIIEFTMHWWVSWVKDKTEKWSLLWCQILITIPGVSEDREGLLDTIQCNRQNYQKRAYQCIKCLVQLFRKSQVALQILQANTQIMRSWSQAVEWLHDELERQRGGQFNYSSWSPPTQSNESTNTYALERSQSARNVLQMAYELCPEDVSSDSWLLCI